MLVHRHEQDKYILTF